MLQLLTLAWFTLVALGLGDTLQQRLDPTIHGLQRVVSAILLGIGMLGALVWVVGWIAWTPAVAWGLLTLLTIPLFFNQRLRRYRAKLPILRERFRYWWDQLTRLDRVLLLAIGVLFGLHLVLAWNPLIGWDASSDHYVIPKLYLQAGHVVQTPQISFGNYPGLIHNVFAWAFALGGLPLAGLFNWLFAALLAVLLYSFGRTLHSRTAGFIATLAFFVSPTIYWLTTTGYLDLIHALFLVALLVQWQHYVRENRPGMPILAGIFAGLALGTKHLAVIHLVCLFAGRLWVAWREGEGRPWKRVFQEL
ncbi:MAG: glycosyltransferase family 39 protein, partial [bacterium]